MLAAPALQSRLVGSTCPNVRFCRSLVSERSVKADERSVERAECSWFDFGDFGYIKKGPITRQPRPTRADPTRPRKRRSAPPARKSTRQLGMVPAAAPVLVAEFEDLEPERVVKPGGDEPAVAPGWVGRRRLEAQQRRHPVAGKRGEILQDRLRIEPGELRHVAHLKLASSARLEPRAGRQQPIRAVAALPAGWTSGDTDAGVAPREARRPGRGDGDRG